MYGSLCKTSAIESAEHRGRSAARNLQHFAGKPMDRVSEIMRTAVATVGPGDSLSRAAELMGHFAVRELPVVENGGLVGILTRSDLEPYGGHLEWTPVRSAMTAPARTVGPDDTIDEAARALRDGNFNGIPVAVGRMLVGMVSRHDLLRVLAGS
jgi:tRNA nucleotidyltransferase (CCA-adding enzyme)